MIRHEKKAAAALPPRWRLGGLIADWTPAASEKPAAPPWEADRLLAPPPAAAVHEIAAGSGGFVPRRAALRLWPQKFAANVAESHEVGWYDFADGDEDAAGFPPDAAGQSRSLPHLTGSAAAAMRAAALLRRLAAVLQPPLERLCAPHGVLEWPAPFLPYQQDGIAALLKSRQLLLADDMGLGKTIQAVAALRLLYFTRQVTSALVVCPAALLRQWRRELARWAPDLTVAMVTGETGERAGLWRAPAHVHLVSYETLRADVLDVRDSPALRAPAWDVMILDEASRIKNRESQIARACKSVPRVRRWALTGTPLENRVEDLISLVEFLDGEPGQQRTRPPTREEAVSRLRHLQLRRKKADVLRDLPPKQINELVVELGPEQRLAYDRAEREGIVRLTRADAPVTITHVLELITRLKQLCNADPVSGASAKLADIAQRLETLTAEGHRALVFSQFTDATFGIGRAAAYLERFAPLSYAGSLSPGRRAAVVDQFMTPGGVHQALLLSLRAGGVGLNLQAASYVFHLDRWWNPAIEDQADARAHRLGQPYPVTVFRYVCAHTIEERIDRTLREKRRLFADVVDDVSLELAAFLTREEIFALFDLKPPSLPAKEPAPVAAPPRFSGMSGEDFEAWVAERLRKIGFAVALTARSRDGGIDIVATRADALGIETRLLVQCKNRSEPSGVGMVRELRGVVPDRAAGTTPVLVCPAGFSADAARFAADQSVRLWGRAELLELDRQANQDHGDGAAGNVLA